MILSSLVSPYSRRFPATIIYMLQSSEYKAVPYLKWFWRTDDFSKVVRRRELERTGAAKWLLRALKAGILLQWLAAAGVIIYALWSVYTALIYLGVALWLTAPIVWAHLILVPLVLGRWIIVLPREQKLIKASEKIFASHTGTTIAVAGSYGKTSMKELLLTVLSEGKKVAATPANKNVSVSHARFAHKLSGDEDILIVEYGEGKPGDIAKFAKSTHPDIGVVTGIAPAHLDEYKSTDQAAADIFSLSQFVPSGKLYVNGDSELARPFIKPQYAVYSSRGALGWEVSRVKFGISETSFLLKNGKETIRVASKLIGTHQVGPLAFAAALARELGLSIEQIERGLSKAEPYAHRMQPYKLDGAWIIDDTYNGNLEGIRAGLTLLKELPAKRKLYVTPGLVDQGKESEAVHKEIGRLIAEAKPDKVVLMKNSVTEYIKSGIAEKQVDLEVMEAEDPLTFYTNLNQFVSVGDLVLMQNDWTDNYA